MLPPVGAGREVIVMVMPLRTTGRFVGFGAMDLEWLREHRGWFFALGIGLMLLGAAAILLPLAASLITALVIGWIMIVGGLFQAFHALQNRRWRGWGWEMVGAVLHLVAGGLVVTFPIAGKLTLTLVFAMFFAINGVIKLVRAFQHRPMRGWGWLVFDGLVSIALGVLIIAGWPGTATWVLGLLVGIDLLFAGSSMLVIAFAARPPHEGTAAAAHP